MTQIQAMPVRRFFQKETIERMIDRLLSDLKEWHNRRSIRKILAGLSPDELRDIGLIENDMNAICAEPLSQDAATELKVKTRYRSTNW